MYCLADDRPRNKLLHRGWEAGDAIYCPGDSTVDWNVIIFETVLAAGVGLSWRQKIGRAIYWLCDSKLALQCTVSKCRRGNTLKSY